jgi:hypothetical protein
MPEKEAGMIMVRTSRMAAALGIVLATWSLATGASGEPMGREDPFVRGHHVIDLHMRYPGDSSYKFGNYRHRGPEQGPYVEQCTWYAQSGWLGLPFGFTQSCIRYTNDNVN